MHVLITGGAGYIGSHTAKAIAANGIVPVVFDNLSRGQAQTAQWGPAIRGDLAEMGMLKQVFARYPIEAVIHFAAFAYVGESAQRPGMYFRNNMVHTLNLLEAMQASGVRRLVLSSSCATYGIPEAVPIRENQIQKPVNPYGESKLAAERMVAWFGEIHGFEWVALRYFNAAGADPEGELGECHDPETHLIPLCLDAALGRIPQLELYGADYDTEDGSAIRDYVHVADLAAAHLAALRHLAAGGASEAFNVGAGIGHSVRQVIASAERTSGRVVPVSIRERRPGDPAVLIADSRRAQEVLGWRPSIPSLDRIVETAFDWQLRRRSKAAAA